jgi:hypothetical protein
VPWQALGRIVRGGGDAVAPYHGPIDAPSLHAEQAAA